MTFAQGAAVAVALFIVTVILGIVVLVAFQREDRREERRRGMGQPPADQQSPDRGESS